MVTKKDKDSAVFKKTPEDNSVSDSRSLLHHQVSHICDHMKEFLQRSVIRCTRWMENGLLQPNLKLVFIYIPLIPNQGPRGSGTKTSSQWGRSRTGHQSTTPATRHLCYPTC